MVLDVAILFLPVVWIWRTQRVTLGKLVYVLLFLAVFLYSYPKFELTSSDRIRTTAISILRLTLLYKRFDASAEYRYELSILAVMYSVIEAHLAVFCAILPRLGYRMFFAWIGENRQRRVSGPDLRIHTLGFTNAGRDGESIQLDQMAYNDILNEYALDNDTQNQDPIELPRVIPELGPRHNRQELWNGGR
ncbi:MAG: hypothetical protein Q9191_005490 [Dirinaria sp. TL-2023a]